jgi:hypothetical protein
LKEYNFTGFTQTFCIPFFSAALSTLGLLPTAGGQPTCCWLVLSLILICVEIDISRS